MSACDCVESTTIEEKAHRNGGLTVLFVADIPTTGGATNSMIELTSSLQERYGATCVVCTHQQSNLNKRLADRGVRSIVTGHGAFLAGGSKFWLKTCYSIVANLIRWRRAINSSIRIVEREIDMSTVDIIHSNLPRTDFGELLAAKYGIPHVCHLRESSFEDFDCVSLRRDPGRFLSDRSASLIAVSHFVKCNWVERGVDAEKVEVIYNGVDTSKIRRRGELSAGSPLKAVFLGGYSENKGIFDILEAVSELPREYLSELQIDVYGFGNQRAAAGFIKRHGIENVVCLNGPLDNVADHLADYDIGLACAKAEAFGRIILEYQAAGLAVVAANRGGFTELIEDGVNGRLYSNNSPESRLSSVLCSLIECPEQCELLATVKKPPRTPKDVALEVYELYQRLLNGPEM